MSMDQTPIGELDDAKADRDRFEKELGDANDVIDDLTEKLGDANDKIELMIEAFGRVWEESRKWA